MPKSTNITSDWTHLNNELACYLQTDAVEITLPTMDKVEANYNVQQDAWQYSYLLPLGKLWLLELVVYLPPSALSVDIETVCKAAIKYALTKQQCIRSQDQANDAGCYYVFILDVQPKNGVADIDNINTSSHRSDVSECLIDHFNLSFFMDDVLLAVSGSMQQQQIFSWQDWHSIITTLQTPCELWRFLGYRLQQLEYSNTNQLPIVGSEQVLLRQFMNSDALFKQAILVDNALIKYGMQDKPNSALVAMKLAQKNNSDAAPMYQQHIQQAALLWSQLITQMIDLADEKSTGTDTSSDTEEQQSLTPQYSHWQQQLRDESLFSRHELVRTLYKHPKQPQALQQSGYVVHQHSYESLGRHYVLIFYGEASVGQHSKAAIQPNLQQIAQDVATRLPIAELHHVIVLGIEFITDATETFIDIDLWIQPVNAMTQKERQLTKQLQRLQQQETSQQQNNQQKAIQSALQITDSNYKPNLEVKPKQQTHELPRIHLNLSIPARSNKP